MGRSARDIALRCQASLWACQVWRATGLRFDELDAVFIPKLGWSIEGKVSENSLLKGKEALATRMREIRVARDAQRAELEASEDEEGADSGAQNRAEFRKPAVYRRTFNRIYRIGHSPERVIGWERGHSNLVEVTALQDPRCGQAKTDYDNPIWRLLARKECPGDKELHEELHAAVGRLGLMLPDVSAVQVGRIVLGETFPVRVNDLDQIGMGADRLAASDSFDAILAASILCKHAASVLAFDVAQTYIEALERAVFRVQERVQDQYVMGTLRELIHRRLLMGNWTPSGLEDWHRASLVRNHGDADSGSPDEDEDEKKVHWWSRDKKMTEMPGAVFATPVRSPAIDDLPPLVNRDARLVWFETYKHSILQSYLIQASGGALTEKLDEYPGNWRELLDQAANFWGPSTATGKLLPTDLAWEGRDSYLGPVGKIENPSARLTRGRTEDSRKK